MHHLAALTGLTRLVYSNNDHVLVDAVKAIAQLPWLRSLWLTHPSAFSDVQLAQLSTLCRLSFLGINGDGSAPIPVCTVLHSQTCGDHMMHRLLLRLYACHAQHSTHC